MIPAIPIPASSNRRTFASRQCAGFTLLELMFSVCVASLLLALAAPTYKSVLDGQKIKQAVVDLAKIGMEIEKYRTLHSEPPMALADLGILIPRDPWGREYRYLNFAADIPGIQAQIRKDHNLHPLNTQFDLYSVGADGESSPPLTAKTSLDDVIYGRDGSFVGKAEDF